MKIQSLPEVQRLTVRCKTILRDLTKNRVIYMQTSYAGDRPLYVRVSKKDVMIAYDVLIATAGPETPIIVTRRDAHPDKVWITF